MLRKGSPFNTLLKRIVLLLTFCLTQPVSKNKTNLSIQWELSQNKSRTQGRGKTGICQLSWFPIKDSASKKPGVVKTKCSALPSPSQIFSNTSKVKNLWSALPAQMSNQHACAQPSQELLASEQIATNYNPALYLRSSIYLWLYRCFQKLLMLPKVRFPVVWEPQFPRDGVSTSDSANHSFCPSPVARRTVPEWNTGFDEWWKNHTAAAPAPQGCSAPCGFWASQMCYCVPFPLYIPLPLFLLTFGKVAFQNSEALCKPGTPVQLHTLRPVQCQDLLHTSPGTTYFWPILLLRNRDRKGGKKILLDLQMIFWNIQVSFLASWQGL